MSDESEGTSTHGAAVRRAREADLPALPGIERAAARLFLPYLAGLGLDQTLLESAKPLEDLRQGLEEGLLWVAVDGADVPVGFALAIEMDGRLHLEEMDVHPEHGRRGLGTALVAAVCTAATGRRDPRVTLSTFREVPWNAPFYARLGFRPLEEPERTPHLRQLRDEEIRRGLLPAARVMMIREG